jgi:hypothetical protein
MWRTCHVRLRFVFCPASDPIHHEKGAYGRCAALLTDMETDVSGIRGLDNVQIHRFANVVNRSHIGTGDLMLDRMKIYRAFIQRCVYVCSNADAVP